MQRLRSLVETYPRKWGNFSLPFMILLTLVATQLNLAFPGTIMDWTGLTIQFVSGRRTIQLMEMHCFQ